MQVNLDDRERMPVKLNGEWLGWQFSKVQRVAIASITLETTHPAAISSLIGIEEEEAKYIIGRIQRNGWDTMAVLEELQLDERADVTMNEEYYSVLRKYGVSE